MRRIAALLLLACALPVMAVAERVSISQLHDQAEAMGRWTKTYEAHGRTIAVDAPIIVPDVDACPVATIERCIPFTDAQVERITAEGRPIEAYRYALTSDDGALYEVMLRPESARDMDATHRVYASVSKGSAPDAPRESEALMTFYDAWEIRTDQACAEGNPATPDDALRLMQAVVDALYPDDDVALAHNRITAYGRRRGADGAPLEDSGYIQLAPLQSIAGIPVEAYIHQFLTGSAQEEKRTQKQRLAVSRLDPRLYISYHDEDFYALMVNANRIRDVIAGDIPLAPLDDVISALEKEIEAGRIRAVMNLRLRYTLFYDGGEADGVCVYPVWLADCVYESSPQKEIERTGYEDVNGIKLESMPYFRRIVVDAQSAAVFDPNHETPEQITCPPFLTWEGEKSSL